MKDSFSWLHFSDLHWGCGTHDDYWDTIYTKLMRDISLVRGKMGITQWDAIFFTGDLVWQGKARWFEKVTNFLTRLKKEIEDECGSIPVLLVVPGNHDLVQPKANDDGLLALLPESPALATHIEKVLKRDNKSSAHKTVVKAFKPFCAWSDEVVQAWNKDHPLIGLDSMKGALPGDFAMTLNKGGRKIGIIGLNSSFLQLRKGDYFKKLAICPSQMTAMFGTYRSDWLNEHCCSFFLTHHPPEWLAAEHFENFGSEIAPPGRFALHLGGHQHAAFALETGSGFHSSKYRYFMAPSLFGEKEKKYDGKVRCHGYAAGKIEFLEDRGVMRLWPRNAMTEQEVYWEKSGKWVFGCVPSEHIDKKKGDEGTLEIPIELTSPCLESTPEALPGDSEILEEIRKILARPAAASLVKAGAGQVGLADSTPDSLARKLVALSPVVAIGTLRASVLECRRNDAATGASLTAWEQAEEVVCWLVLQTIPEENVSDFLEGYRFGGELAAPFLIYTKVGIEILMARLGRRRMEVVPDGTGGTGLRPKLGVDGDNLFMANGTAEHNALKVIKELWTDLYKEHRDESYFHKLISDPEGAEMVMFRGKLTQRSDNRRGHYLVVKVEDGSMTPAALARLRQLLPSPCLRQVIMQGKREKVIFLDKCEPALIGALEDFYEIKGGL